MAPRVILGRWIALRGKDAILRARQTVMWLSLGAFALTLIVGYCAIFTDLPAIVLVLPAVAIGWIIAERNALKSRLEQWPVLSGYLDWPKIERDWAVATKGD